MTPDELRSIIKKVTATEARPEGNQMEFSRLMDISGQSVRSALAGTTSLARSTQAHARRIAWAKDNLTGEQFKNFTEISKSPIDK